MGDYSTCDRCGAEKKDVFVVRHGRRKFTRLHTYACGSDCAVTYPMRAENRKYKCEENHDRN